MKRRKCEAMDCNSKDNAFEGERLGLAPTGFETSLEVDCVDCTARPFLRGGFLFCHYKRS